MVKRNLTSEKLLSSTKVLQKPKEDGAQKDSDLVKDEYKKNYDNKQEQWNEEDVQQGNMEKLEKEKKKETKLFLNQIKRRPRFAQIFVDQYSLRDENVNKNIIEINKTQVYFIDYDNLIITKKASNRPKDILDIEELEKINKKTD